MAGPDLSVMTAVVDFATVTVAVLGVAAAWLAVHVAWVGASMVIAAVRGGVYENNDGTTFTGRELDRIWRDMSASDRDDWGFDSKKDMVDSIFTRVR